MDEIGKSSGYPQVALAEDLEALEDALSDCDTDPGPHLILVKAGIAPVEGIPRISHSPTAIRDRFKDHVLPGAQTENNSLTTGPLSYRTASWGGGY